MTKHLLRDLDHLKRELLVIGAMVEEATTKAIVALTDRRVDLAREVMHCDDAIDEKEVQLEEECLKILALHQPVAADLRYIIGVLKVNNDLERMGDLAVNIAERAEFLASHEALEIELDFPGMARRVKDMVRESLTALIERDVGRAERILEMDEEVDQVHRRLYSRLEIIIRRSPDAVTRCFHLLSASRNLERIADLTTNIAEDVVFMVEGELIRHRPWEERASRAGPPGRGSL